MNTVNFSAGSSSVESDLLILGIESSCDETAAAVVDGERRILSSVVRSQTEEHELFGGVVPEIAARAHLIAVKPVVATAVRQAGVPISAITAIAATTGPGLIGGVTVGTTFGKALALALGRPFVAINHLEAHALSGRLTHDIAFPFLLLLVSGGHSQLLAVFGVGNYHLIGTTLDDAAGEAFDKAAKMLGLGFPGGPAIEQAAKLGDPMRFVLPRPMVGREGADFSFSGLKTALRRSLELLSYDIDTQTRADFAASLQTAVADVIIDRTSRAFALFPLAEGRPSALVVAGGVAANCLIRARLNQLAADNGLPLVAPPLELCTDNAAMVAWAGIERFRLGLTSSLDIAPRPRWPLDASK